MSMAMYGSKILSILCDHTAVEGMDELSRIISEKGGKIHHQKGETLIHNNGEDIPMQVLSFACHWIEARCLQHRFAYDFSPDYFVNPDPVIH